MKNHVIRALCLSVGVLSLYSSVAPVHAQSDRSSAFTRNLGDNSNSQQSTSVSEDPTPPLSIEPESLKVSQSVTTQTVLLRNLSMRSVNVGGFDIVGVEKSVNLVHDECSGTQLNRFSTCVAVFRIHPGTEEGDVLVRHSGIGDIQRIPVVIGDKGSRASSAEPGNAVAYPEKINFDEVDNYAKRYRTVVVVNEGDRPVTIDSVSIYPEKGPVSLSDEEIDTDMAVCEVGNVIDAKQGCVALLQWSPSADVSNEASFLLSHSGSQTVVDVPISGEPPEGSSVDSETRATIRKEVLKTLLEDAGVDIDPGMNFTNKTVIDRIGRATAPAPPSQTSSDSDETSVDKSKPQRPSLTSFDVLGFGANRVLIQTANGNFVTLRDGDVTVIDNVRTAIRIHDGAVSLSDPESGAVLRQVNFR